MFAIFAKLNFAQVKNENAAIFVTVFCVRNNKNKHFRFNKAPDHRVHIGIE
jgi:hypothetical protein